MASHGERNIGHLVWLAGKPDASIEEVEAAAAAANASEFVGKLPEGTDMPYKNFLTRSCG
jgi:ABC-type transport system involved in Fe-S cluster assembly fused permease/ATPase subunit